MDLELSYEYGTHQENFFLFLLYKQCRYMKQSWEIEFFGQQNAYEVSVSNRGSLASCPVLQRDCAPTQMTPSDHMRVSLHQNYCLSARVKIGSEDLPFTCLC